MYKELVICIFMVISIVIGDIATQNDMEDTINKLSKNLEKIKEELREDKIDKKEIESNMEEFENEWKNESKKMAYYIEHSELKDIWEEIIKVKSNIEIEEYSQGIESLDYCIFLLTHLKDKAELKLINIF